LLRGAVDRCLRIEFCPQDLAVDTAHRQPLHPALKRKTIRQAR
jgi:hypothetical protein